MGLGGSAPRPARSLALATAVAALAAACTMPPPPEQPRAPIAGPTPSVIPTPVLRLAIRPPASLDPRDLDTPESLLVASQIFDGLVAYDPTTLDAVPAVAETWDVVDGGRTIVFHLREGVTYHDGSPVTAADFVTAWNRLADPIASKPYAFLLEHVEGFQKYQEDLSITALAGLSAPDARTFEVRLSRPWPEFVAVAGHPALSPVPPAAAEPGFANQPPGNGPYRVATPLTPGVPLTLQRHDGYYGSPAALQTVEFRPYETADQAWPDFLSGELEVAEVPPAVLPQAKSRFGDRGIVTLGRLLYCGLNQGDERFRDARLRTAVSLALDRERIAQEVYGGVAQPADAIVPPSIPGASAGACGAACRNDAQEAASAVRALPNRSRRFSLDYAASTVGDRLASTIAAQLRDAGFRVTPTPHEERAFEDLLEAGEHEMFCLVWIADYPRQQSFLEPLLASGSPDNHTRVEDPSLDASLEAARARLDASAREELYADVEERALAQMHVIPVVWFRSHLAVQPYVDGFSLDPMARYEAASLSVSP